MLCRATFFFEQQGYGWTESWWNNQPAFNTLPQFGAKVTTLGQKLAAIRGAETVLKLARYSAEGVRMDRAFVFFNGNAGLPGYASQESDAPDTVALLRSTNLAATRAKPTYWRGIWDTCVKNGGIWTPPASWTSRFSAVKGELLQEGWGWMGQDTSVGVLVANVLSNANGTVRITCADAVLPMGVGQYTIRVSGVQGAASINGVQIVNAVSTSIMDTVKRIPIFVYTAGGRVRFSSLTFIPFADAQVTRVVERRAGRVFYRSVGRRPGRVLA